MKCLKQKHKTNKQKEHKESKDINNKEKENNALLEAPYDILSEDIFNLNEKMHEDLLKCIKEYRKARNENSNALLALLWFYPEHDDILFNLEEEFRPIYESADVVMDKKKKQVIEQDKKDFDKQVQNYFQEVKIKRINKIENNKSRETQKKKHEEKIKKNLQNQMKLQRIMSGHDPMVKSPDILTTEAGIVNLPIIENKFDSQTKGENNYSETSNMLQAINAASEKYNLKNNYLKKTLPWRDIN